MPAGKLSAQAGHAYADSLWNCLALDPDLAHAYQSPGADARKSTIQARSLRQLERAARECAEAGIPHRIVVDRDHVLLPHFTGAPIVTALGVGPTTKAASRRILKRFMSVA